MSIYYFIFYFIMLGIIAFFLLACTAVLCQADWEEIKPYATKAIIIVLILSAVMGRIKVIQYNSDIKDYNNGICTECNGKLKLFDIEKAGRYGSIVTYYYQCEDCEHIVKTSLSMN